MCFLVFSQILLLFDDFMASLIRLGLVQTSWQSRSQVLPTNMENAGIHLDSLHIYIYIYICILYTYFSISIHTNRTPCNPSVGRNQGFLEDISKTLGSQRFNMGVYLNRETPFFAPGWVLKG